jgi:hypothetical protein
MLFALGFSAGVNHRKVYGLCLLRARSVFGGPDVSRGGPSGGLRPDGSRCDA